MLGTKAEEIRKEVINMNKLIKTAITLTAIGVAVKVISKYIEIEFEVID